ncbi:MAG: sulfatase-like hydrolase/transferase [Candidatus Hydrogenedens sp.]
MKRMISILLKASVTIGLFVLLFWPETFGLSEDTFGGVKPGALINEIRSLNLSHALPWVLFALLIRLAGIMSGVVRWKILLNGQNLYMPFTYMTQSWFIGRTIGIFLPSTIGLDGYRLYDSVRYTGDVIRCATVIFIEKIIGFISLTTLVFLTFPLGFRLLRFNTLFLIIILMILGFAVLFFLSLLLQPYIIQIILYAVPIPKKIKNILNRLGSSATAYAGHRKYLLLAILCGLFVHLSACLMYFGTMMALRSENTSLWDVLFASPLMIYGTVLGPSVGGEGIREIVFATLLGGKENTLKVVAFAHLGWWIGDVIPFLIGLPFLVLRKRPQKEEIQKQMSNIQSQATFTTGLPQQFNPQELLAMRNQIFRNLLYGIIGGFSAGAFCGFVESLWIIYKFTNLHEYQMLWWGPLMYGITCAGIGLGIGIFIGGWFPLLIKKFPSSLFIYVVSVSATLLSTGFVLVLWRYWRDILLQKPVSYQVFLPLSCYYLGIMLIFSAVFYIVLFYLSRRSKKFFYVVIILCLFLPFFLGACYISIVPSGGKKENRVSLADAHPNSPNIILIIADALRADYLPAYNPDIETKTPELDKFIEKSILFKDCNSHSSWTKPAFASIYTGVIPSQHYATTKNAIINSNLPTVADVLSQNGYLTKGFANNPNVHSLFGFNKGFIEYTELQPKRVFFAGDSSARLTIYEILRRVYGKISSIILKILNKPPDVREYYQPAEIVTSEALQWIDNRSFKEHPFYLVLHYMDTHDPYFHPEKKTFYPRALLGNTPKSHLTPLMRDAYIAEIEYLDKYFGKFLNELEKRGLLSNSYVIFTADHGEEFEDHQGWWHGFTLYQEMLHVPLIIKVPDVYAEEINTNQKVEGLVRHIDLSATLTEIAGITQPKTFTGKPLLSKDGKIIKHEEVISWAENETEGQIMQSIRRKDQKLILANPDNPRGLKPEELYVLSKDPKEKNNLSTNNDYLIIKQDLLQLMDMVKRNKEEQTDKKVPEQTTLPQELIEQLKATGYMQ